MIVGLPDIQGQDTEGAMSRGRILIIGAPGEETATLCALLEPVPVQATSVQGVEAALRILHEEQFHVVLATPRAVSENGGAADLVGCLKTRGDTVPVLVVAAHKDARRAERLPAAGAFDVMILPADRPALTGVVQQALRRNGLACPQAPAGSTPPQAARPLPFLVGTSSPMQDLRGRIAQAAAADAPVCVLGEPGTGKELVARAIHYASPRAAGPILVLDCSAVRASLLESELFGHVTGAFPAAVADRNGLVQLAHGGSLLVDKIEALGPPLQAHLLRVLQSRELRKVGGNAPIPVEVRLIATTREDLAALTRAGAFCQELFAHLARLSIRVPPLRERPDDIPLLVDHVIARWNRNNRKHLHGVHPTAIEALLRSPWPGNVRELETCLERAAVLVQGPWLTVEDLSAALQAAPLTDHAGADETAGTLNLREVEQTLLLRALRRAGGDKTRAAALLGISLRALYYKLKALEEAESPTTSRTRGAGPPARSERTGR